MRLDGKEAYIRPLSLSDVDEVVRLRVDNRGFLTPFEPLHTDRFYTKAGQRDLIEQAMKDSEKDRGFAFGIFDLTTDEMVGRVALSNVVRGGWQNATLGYFIAEAHNGRGLATQAVGLIVDFAFGPARLHRVQAGVMLRNKASAQVLVKNGFRYEGRSARYLKINGVWEDHDMYAITVEDR